MDLLPDIQFSRRRFFAISAVASLAGGLGIACGGPRLARAPGFPRQRWQYTAREKELLAKRSPSFEIVVRESPTGGLLRRHARPVPQGLDLSRVARRMEHTMRQAKGVGIAGPQVGLSLRIATLMLDYKTPHPRVIFVRNPLIVERSEQMNEGYEGCLSIPGVGGLVRRHQWIRVQHTSLEGEVLSQEAEGPNAVLWQHELDHLDGVLYVDLLLGELLPMEEVRRRRRLKHAPTSRPSGAELWPAGFRALWAANHAPIPLM